MNYLQVGWRSLSIFSKNLSNNLDPVPAPERLEGIFTS